MEDIVEYIPSPVYIDNNQPISISADASVRNTEHHHCEKK
jgi:hypothetical protein